MAVFCCFFCHFNLRPITSHAIPYQTTSVVKAVLFPAELRTERLFLQRLLTYVGVFLGTHENRFDAKGRISIPAGFRSVLKTQQTEGDALMILRPSHTLPCVEAWPAVAFARLTEPLDRLDMFSDEHDDLAAALYADAYPIDPDREGRIILPDFLREHAGLTESSTAAFMGVGRIFQIWEPQAAQQRRAEARQRSRRVSIPAANGTEPKGRNA